MEDAVLELIRDQFVHLNTKLDLINTTIEKHIDKDEEYWRKIDQVEGQISLLKWLGGSISFSGLLAWLFGHFGKH